MTPAMTPEIARAIRVFEALSEQSVTELATIYAPDAHFVDPFNAVQGIDAITQVFAHMFATLDNPHFVVTGSVVQADPCFLLWDFRFRFPTFRLSERMSTNPSREPAICASPRTAASRTTMPTGTRHMACTSTCRCSAD